MMQVQGCQGLITEPFGKIIIDKMENTAILILSLVNIALLYFLVKTRIEREILRSENDMLMASHAEEKTFEVIDKDLNKIFNELKVINKKLPCN